MVIFILGFLIVSRLSDGSSSSTLGVLGLFAYAVLRVLPALNRSIANLNNIEYASEALANVLADLQLRPPLGAEAPSVDRLDFTDAVCLRQVSFRYEGAEVDALRDIDLVIRPGELLGVVGPTGAGKTTLIDLILGLVVPTRGTITVDGDDMGSCRAAWLQTVGVVPQFPFLLDDTMRRNVALGIDDQEIDEDRVAYAIELARLASVVAGLPEGLDTVIGERGVRLSGGQRQRVAIARALYRDPQVLVFDEGTSSLDNVTEAEVISALDTLRGTRTIVTIAHRLTTVQNCDRVAYMESGRILDIGPFQEMLQRSAEFKHQVG